MRDMDRPYPLRRNFRRRILPAFVGLLLLVPGLAGWGGAGLIENVYLQLAQRRAEIIDRAASEEAGAAWLALKATILPKAVYAGPGGDALLKVMQGEVGELALSQLKVYGRGGVILFDTDPEAIGTVDASPAFHAAMLGGKRTAVFKPLDDGSALYELYVPLPAPEGTPPVVFELYEQTSHLNALLLEAAAPVALVSALLLLGILWGLSRLVSHAQEDIDGRSERLAELRARVEGFVSASAVTAARESLGTGAIRSKRVELTLLYSDVRGFTDFSEGVEPEVVIAFLNRVMGLQIEVVRGHQGDVDKMIGDALLARFEGDGREARALRAAVEIQKGMATADLPRGLGIGVFSGAAISGVIGPVGRQDFTVIGDSVNAAARLCAEARKGEIVVDAESVSLAKVGGFGPSEEVTVKGKQKPLVVRRWAVGCA